MSSGLKKPERIKPVFVIGSDLTRYVLKSDLIRARSNTLVYNGCGPKNLKKNCVKSNPH
jgi:hypothetical protein